MIGNPYKGRSFKGLVRYLHHGRANDPKPHRVIWSEGRNIATTDDKVVPAIMIATAALSSGVKKPVYHLPISWPPEEKLPKEAQLQVADQLLADLGLSEHQTLIVAHDDGDCPHIHIVVNTVHPDTGRVWNAWRDVFRIMESLERQEKELGLRIVDRPHLEAHRSGQKIHDREHSPTRDERKRAERMDDIPLGKWSEAEMRERRKLITDHFKVANSWSDLEGRLQRHGLKLIEAGQGFRITDGTHFMQMSKVGKHARTEKLEARFMESWEEYQLLREDPKRISQIEPPDYQDDDSDDAYIKMLDAEANARKANEKAQDERKRLATALLSYNDLEWYRLKEKEAVELATKQANINRALRSQKYHEGRIIREHDQIGIDIAAHCRKIYRDPKAAMAAIQKELDAGKTIDQINLSSVGKLRGWKFFGWASKAHNDAKRVISSGVVQRSQERMWRLRNQHEITQHEALTLTAQLGDIETRMKEVRRVLGSDHKRKEIKNELYRNHYSTLRHITKKEVMESELRNEEKERLLTAKAALPPSRYGGQAEAVSELSVEDIWRSDLPEDMKYRLVRQLEGRIQQERQAEREAVKRSMEAEIEAEQDLGRDDDDWLDR